MNTYELTFLADDNKEVENLKKVVKAHDGKILEEKSWGNRDLCFPIKKRKAADYYTWQIQLDHTNLLEFKKKLTFNEGILRHLLLKVDTK